MIAWMASAWAGCLVVQGGSLFDGERFADGDLVAVDGRIAAVGQVAGLVPRGDEATWQGRTCARVALPAGSVVTPGFVEARSAVGLAEVGLEKASVDTRAGGDPVRAALVVSEAYHPASVHVPVMRLGGVTSVVLMPEGGRIAGQAGWARLAGQSQAEAVVDPSVAMVAGLGGSSFAESLLELRELLEDARAFGANTTAVEQNRYRPFAPGASRLDLIALQPVLKGEIPLVVPADRASDIEAVLRLAAELKVRVVITGAAEGWKVAKELAAAKVPVIVDPLTWGPTGLRAIHASPQNASRLDAAGVTVVLSAQGAHNASVLGQVAGNAVRAGLSREAALRAITEAPARVFGQDDRGALQVGSVADFVAFSGDPFELSTDVLAVVIGGERQPLVSRQTELAERYRVLPGSPLPGLDPAGAR